MVQLSKLLTDRTVIKMFMELKIPTFTLYSLSIEHRIRVGNMQRFFNSAFHAQNIGQMSVNLLQ